MEALKSIDVSYVWNEIRSCAKYIIPFFIVLLLCSWDSWFHVVRSYLITEVLKIPAKLLQILPKLIWVSSVYWNRMVHSEWHNQKPENSVSIIETGATKTKNIFLKPFTKSCYIRKKYFIFNELSNSWHKIYNVTSQLNDSASWLVSIYLVINKFNKMYSNI